MTATRPHAPSPGAVLPHQTLAQEQLRKPMPGPHQVCAGVLPSPHQVPRSPLGLSGHPHPGQLPDPQQPRQPLSVTTIGRDPIPRRAFQLRRGHHLAPDPRHPSARARPTRWDRPQQATATGPGNEPTHATMASVFGDNRNVRISPPRCRSCNHHRPGMEVQAYARTPCQYRRTSGPKFRPAQPGRTGTQG
jgi:hypothetical protein